MIDASELVARTRSGHRVQVGPLAFSLAAGVSHAFVGAPHDGGPLVLAVLAGSVAARSGKVTVLGAPPHPRKNVAYVPLAPGLPSALFVDELLVMAAATRGEALSSPEKRLAVLGVAPLARRRIASLTPPEERAVALVEALTSRADLLLLEDPLVDLDPRAVGHVATALRGRVLAGAMAVVATASVEDARALASEWYTITQGKLGPRTADADEWSPPGPAGRVTLFVRSEGARFLLAELAADRTFDTVEANGAELVVTGKDAVAMAQGVAEASRRANAELDLLRFVAPEPHR